MNEWKLMKMILKDILVNFTESFEQRCVNKYSEVSYNHAKTLIFFYQYIIEKNVLPLRYLDLHDY